MEHDLKIGEKLETTITVTENLTAKAVGSGGLEVYGTPFMVGLMEMTSLNLAQDHLPEGYSTVGTCVNIVHTSATPLGMKVTATSELIKIDGKILTFNVSACDEKGEIGKGIHERAIIGIERFLEKVNSKLV